MISKFIARLIPSSVPVSDMFGGLSFRQRNRLVIDAPRGFAFAVGLNT